MAAALDATPPAKLARYATDKGAVQVRENTCCPECGAPAEAQALAHEAQRRIQELEAQVELLKEKATTAVDKCADYEDQLRSIRAPNGDLPRSNTSDSLTPSRPSNEDARPSTSHSNRQSRFSFLTGRRSSPSLVPAVPATQDTELLEQLDKERKLRARAEERAEKVDAEIEELSVQLFSQANEMVAEERRARAKLEARVEQLEKKDKEKVKRLERLESAVQRVDRVKALLAAPTPVPARR